MNIKVINTCKGRYFYSHLVPIIRQTIPDFDAQLVQASDIKDLDTNVVIFGQEAHKDLSNANFLLIDRFIQETISYSFTKKNIEELLEQLECLQK